MVAVLIPLTACSDSSGPRRPQPGLTIVSGGNGSDTINAVLARPLVIEVRGANAEPLEGVEVVFEATNPIAVGESTPHVKFMGPQGSPIRWHLFTDTTDALGRASVSIWLGRAAGTDRVIVTAPSLGMETGTTYTIRPGNAVNLRVTPADAPVFVGGTLQLNATLVDQAGNPIVSTATFSSEATTIQLSASGRVQGVALGRAQIAVRIGSRLSTAFISVIPRGAVAIRAYGTYAGDPMGIAQVNLDGSGFRWIAQTGPTPDEYTPSNHDGPQWIPGTGQVVYARVVNGRGRLFIGDSTGAARRVIEGAYGAIAEAAPDVSADGAWIYFIGPDSVGIQSLWRVPTSGGAPEQLTDVDDGREFFSPTVSPDGKRLAYVARGFPWERFRLYVRDIAAGIATVLPATEPAGPRWSPTGEWILYTQGIARAGFTGPLRLIRPDGGEDRSLVGDPCYSGGSWSPDGRYVLCVRGMSPDATTAMELIDVVNGMRLPVMFGTSWFAPSWRR